LQQRQQVHEHEGGEDDEYRRQDGVAGRAVGAGPVRSRAPQQEESEAAHGEGEPVEERRELHQVEHAAEREADHGEAALERDRDPRRAPARMDLADALEEEAVVGHREVDARRDEEQRLRDREGRQHHQRRDEDLAARDHAARGLGGRRDRVREAFHAEDRDERDVQQQVERDHRDRPDHDADRQRALRLLDL
jgi:hypothetical protein